MDGAKVAESSASRKAAKPRRETAHKGTEAQMDYHRQRKLISLRKIFLDKVRVWE
jgi:hypothetical protein